jgi:hypothetical protein
MADTPSTMDTTPLRPTSRAALRSVEAGNYVDCARCGDRVKFQAKLRKQQVICNVYIDGRWDRVEHYHAECYNEAGQPHGTPTDEPERRYRGRSTAA